jgi:DNA-binding transcriptional regulator YiaG
MTKPRKRSIRETEQPEYCGNGHLLAGDNVRFVDGHGWRCVTCVRESAAKAVQTRYAARFAKKAGPGGQVIWLPCKAGHEPTPENTIQEGAVRLCRTCTEARKEAERKAKGIALDTGPEPVVTAVEVKQARSWLRVTHDEFARYCGVEPAEVWRWERGRGRPTGKVAYQIAAAVRIAAG